MTEPIWITTEEAARLMGITGAGVRRQCKYHQIKCKKFGNAWMIDKQAALNYKRLKPGPKNRDGN